MMTTTIILPSDAKGKANAGKKDKAAHTDDEASKQRIEEGVEKVRKYFSTLKEPIHIIGNANMKQFVSQANRHGNHLESCNAVILPKVKDYKDRHHIVVRVYPQSSTLDDKDSACISARILSEAINLNAIVINLGTNVVLKNADFPVRPDGEKYYVFDVEFAPLVSTK